MNHERWLVSYADFITLLFAFFVVMFASSQVDKRKMAVIAATFESYAQGRSPGPQGHSSPPGSAHAAQSLTAAQMAGPRERLEDALRQEITEGKIELSLQPRGLVLSLKESAFFASGQDAIHPEALPIMTKVAQGLAQIPGQVRLEGHTDNTPIHTPRFPSNWQLSTARAIAVLKLLTQDLGLPAGRFSVAGYGEHHPLESNDTQPGRTRNRRVDLVVLTLEAASLGPG